MSEDRAGTGMERIPRRRVGLAWLTMLVLAPFAGAAGSGDVTLDRAIAKANSEWAVAMKTGDAAVIAAPYADDGIFIAADGSVTRGRVAVEKMYRERFERNGLAVSTKIEPRSVTLDGDLGLELGYAEIGSKKEGGTTTSGRRYFTVWQRRSGEWKIVRNLVLP